MGKMVAWKLVEENESLMMLAWQTIQSKGLMYMNGEEMSTCKTSGPNPRTKFLICLLFHANDSSTALQIPNEDAYGIQN